jgi:AraC family transcriptional regulator
MNRSTDIYQRRINRVIDHLNDNLNRSFPLKELASVAYSSAFQFTA